MTVPQQKLLPNDLRCRLALSSVYVSRINISWYWHPDALARWNSLIPSRLVYLSG